MTTPARPARRRAVAVLAALAVGLAGLFVAAAPAHAETRAVEEGTLAWGFKESFRNYVARQIGAVGPIGPAPEGERITVADGASFDLAATPAFPGSTSDPNESLPYVFGVAGGKVTDAANLVVRTQGAVTYHFPSHHFVITLSNLGVVVEGGTARLVGDILQIATEAFGDFPAGRYEVLGGTIGTVDDADVTIEGDQVTVRGSGLTVHADAAEALPQGPGEDLDDFTLTATLGEVVEDDGDEDGDEDGTPKPTPSPTPTPEPEPGELSWRVEASRVSLGTASATDESFLATASLPAVVVTDTRAGGPAWRVTAQVSDFTSADDVLRARHLGWVPTLLAPGGGAEAGKVVTPRLVTGSGKGLAAARTLGSAPAGHPTGTATLGGTLELRAPLGTAPGSYRAVLTITAVS